MKVLGIKEAKATLSDVVRVAQGERVILTRNGKPSVMLIGIEGEDLEEVILASAPEVWELLRRRREGRSFSEEEARRRLLGDPPDGKKSVPRRKKKAS